MNKLQFALLAVWFLPGIPGARAQTTATAPTTSAPAITFENPTGGWSSLGPQLAKLTDVQIEGLLLNYRPQLFSQQPDFYLAEIARRGGKHWEDWATAHLAPPKSPFGKQPQGLDAQSLTVLRRIQRKEDPLLILKRGKSEITTEIGYSPALELSLTNLDSERKPVSFLSGGDYRGAGRHNKWRIEVRDQAGHLLPIPEARDEGGFVGYETLDYGESESENLWLAGYAIIDHPGVYTLTVYYHPEIGIANDDTIDGLICFHSFPIKLTVEPITISSTAEAQTRAEKLASQLPDKAPVHILGGSYPDHDMETFMPKDSPAAQLKLLRWEAVPALIRAINGNQITDVQRAWALGLLYGITGLYNRMNETGLLPAYEYRNSGWVSAGGPGLAASFQSSENVSTGTIDAKAQKEFAKKWLNMLEQKNIQLEITPPVPTSH